MWTKYLAIFRQPYFQGSKVWQQLLGKSHHVRVYIAYSDFEAKDFIHLGLGMETIKKPKSTNNSIKLSWFMNMFELVGVLDGFRSLQIHHGRTMAEKICVLFLSWCYSVILRSQRSCCSSPYHQEWNLNKSPSHLARRWHANQWKRPEKL